MSIFGNSRGPDTRPATSIKNPHVRYARFTQFIERTAHSLPDDRIRMLETICKPGSVIRPIAIGIAAVFITDMIVGTRRLASSEIIIAGSERLVS